MVVSLPLQSMGHGEARGSLAPGPGKQMYFPNGKNSRSQRKGCKTEFLPDDSVVNNLPANAGDSFYP